MVSVDLLEKNAGSVRYQLKVIKSQILYIDSLTVFLLTAQQVLQDRKLRK